MKKKILIASAFILSIAMCFCTIFINDEKVKESISETQNIIYNEIEKQDVVVSDETKNTAENTIEAVKKDEQLDTTKTITNVEEKELETDAVVEQENISYNGDIKSDGIKLLGAYQGLTYYSQADKRWANQLYTSSNNKSQTMKSSACGPTSAAMVVTASKGTILPTTMAKLYVDNGYRTKSNGTAWSAFSFTADYFGFKEYHTTSSYNTAMKYLDNGYYVISACGNGLFTTSGHYIFLTSSDKNNIKVYDPYLYNNKFNTASRKKANVKVNKNTVTVSKTNFKKYANVKQYFIFSNDKGSGNTKKIVKKTVTKSTVGKKKTLKSNCILYSKKNLKGKKYTYKKNTKVKILKNINKNVDYVQVIATKRKAYINNKNYK